MSYRQHGQHDCVESICYDTIIVLLILLLCYYIAMLLHCYVAILLGCAVAVCCYSTHTVLYLHGRTLHVHAALLGDKSGYNYVVRLQGSERVKRPPTADHYGGGTKVGL